MWTYIKALFNSIGKWFLRYPIAMALTVILIVGSVFLLASGKTIQIGGLLDKIWGRKKESSRGVPPDNRIDKDGKLIQPGESDDGGWVQAPVIKEIKKLGLFDDPKTITIVHPEKGEVKIELPEGIKNKDVKEVIEISPNVYEVRNNDSGVNTDELLDILGGK